MKKILLSFSILLLFATMIVGCTDGDRIDQKSGMPVPEEVTVVGTKSTPGGAVIKVKIPDDPNLKGVCASYVRNGEVVEARISRYLDTLVVEGYADEEEHEVEIRSFNADNEMSEAKTVTITPLPAPVQTADFTAESTFGGLSVTITNNTSLAQFAIVIQADSAYVDEDLAYEDRKWKDVTTLFTASNNVTLKRRGMEAVKKVFAIHLRDDWGNTSAVKMVTLTPLEEIKLTKSLIKQYNYDGTDATQVSSYYPISGLFDDSGASAAYKFFASADVTMPSWLTFNLGQTAMLSRIAVLPRQQYNIWTGAAVRELEFWGAYDDPATGIPDDGTDASRHGFNSAWFCLGVFEQYKPSGYLPDGSVGSITEEDATYYNYNTEYEMDPKAYPHAWDKIRYLRLVVINTFATKEENINHGQWSLGELTPWGQVDK